MVVGRGEALRPVYKAMARHGLILTTNQDQEVLSTVLISGLVKGPWGWWVANGDTVASILTGVE